MAGPKLPLQKLISVNAPYPFCCNGTILQPPVELCRIVFPRILVNLRSCFFRNFYSSVLAERIDDEYFLTDIFKRVDTTGYMFLSLYVRMMAAMELFIFQNSFFYIFSRISCINSHGSASFCTITVPAPITAPSPISISGPMNVLAQIHV